MLNSKIVIGLVIGIGVAFFLAAVPVAFIIGTMVTKSSGVVPPAPTEMIIPPQVVVPTTPPQPIPGSISGRVWHDLCANTGQTIPPTLPAIGCTYPDYVNGYQANGIYESGEPAIGGVSVSLGAGACPSFGLANVWTQPDGIFFFPGLSPGVYCVTIDPYAGANAGIMIPGRWTYPAQYMSISQASYSITLAEGQEKTDVSFGWDYQFLPLPPATPTYTPLPTFTPTKTKVPLPCNWAQFIADVTVPDGTPIVADTSFMKTWRLKNIGSCAWTTDYDLVFISGDAMTNKTIVALPRKVAPNETVDISVKLNAPKKPGTYKGNWMLQNASGVRFGIGTAADKPIWVQINVVTTSTNFGLDFVSAMCKAEWRSAVKTLPCPGSITSTNGFVQVLNNPKLENRGENEPTLWTHPNNKNDGWISGTYPVYTVKTNDHFRALVGCLDGSNGCNVLFRLQYRENNGPLVNIKKWTEIYDGKVTEINLDLTDLAGKKVQFVLTVEVRGGDPAKANAFWFMPRIQQVVPPPTATPTVTATETSTSVP